VDYVHDGSFHSGSLQVAVCAAVNVSQRFAQILRVFDVDGDEFKDAILRENTDDHSALCFIIDIDERDSTSTRLEHTATGRVQRLERMDRDSLDRLHANGFFNVAETVQTELIDLSESIGVLPVVLDDVDVVRGGEQASKSRSFRVPERSRYDAFVKS
jgi:hypothetical protein